MNDFKNIVSSKLNTLGFPASTIASLSDVSGGRFSNWLNGVSSLPHDKAQQTYGVVIDLERLVDLTAPLPLDFSKVNALRRCIEGLRDGTLKILVQQNEPSTQQKAFAIQFGNGNFFHSQDRDGQILHTINFLQGAMVRGRNRNTCDYKTPQDGVVERAGLN
jgi:hypothetical protein